MRSAAAAIVLATALAACNRPAEEPGAAAAPAPATNPLLLQARESLKRAETAPLPTPPPPPSPIPRGWKPLPAPELKPEEIEAIRLLEQAAAASPKQADVHELLARTLEPHALREHARTLAERGKKSPPPRPPDPGVDVSPARAARAYRAAIEADASSSLVGPLIEFAGKVDDVESMDWAHQESIRRAKDKASVAPRILYGDFLRDRRRDPMAAADQYRAAMMWDANDTVTRAKVADIYLELVREHYDKREYVGAETRLREAEKYVLDPASPQGQRLADYRRRLAALRN
jgi:hypothetical protein